MKKTNLFLAFALLMGGGMMTHLAHGIDPQEMDDHRGADRNTVVPCAPSSGAVDQGIGQNDEHAQTPPSRPQGDMIVDGLKEALKEAVSDHLSRIWARIQGGFSSILGTVSNISFGPDFRDLNLTEAAQGGF